MARLCERLCLGFVQRRLAATHVPQPGYYVSVGFAQGEGDQTIPSPLQN